MTTAYWCVLIAALFPYVGTLSAKIGGRMPRAANHGPRQWLDSLGAGWQKRAYWAQLNSFEVFPAFAAAVIIAHQIHVPQPRLDLLAELFIVSRIVYFAVYLADLATLRSIVWFCGMACMVMLFVSGA